MATGTVFENQTIYNKDTLVLAKSLINPSSRDFPKKADTLLAEVFPLYFEDLIEPQVLRSHRFLRAYGWLLFPSIRALLFSTESFPIFIPLKGAITLPCLTRRMPQD